MLAVIAPQQANISRSYRDMGYESLSNFEGPVTYIQQPGSLTDVRSRCIYTNANEAITIIQEQ